ncbi:Mediator of RNA polymerase II transcription subunit 30 [Blattella germanica]|nr:Mediator of RNA polymerase II transcription subunit 30 [Blattella germanica]
MAGPQHTFPSGFPNAQQGAMRNQFGGAPQIGGLMSSAQQSAVNQSNTQQQQATQQQQQQNPAQQQPANKEFNTASLCRFGQETVQDIVTRTQEVFQTLKIIQPPNGTAQGANTSNEKKAKVQEQLRTIRLLFKRLRLIYEKCNENCQGMEYTHIESLIPLKEEWDMKSDEKKTSESYRLVCEENKEIMEQVILKNRHLKEIIDHLRRIIWEINTMLTMRRS